MTRQDIENTCVFANLVSRPQAHPPAKTSRKKYFCLGAKIGVFASARRINKGEEGH
jgi:hypothetical protein